MKRAVCLHGHFYQPPRENPWIEEVEVQDSAAPFHDWNERIEAECYGPNGAARLKAQGGRICDIVNNYVHLSFNFGPTLLAWLERQAPEVYRAVLDADVRSVQERGHGNAIAQGYNHAILPLCNERDLRTQIRWGIGDFRHRFRRQPEGMWLPETAADLRTLQALQEEGIRFTVLSPYQCRRVRAPGGEWLDAAGGRFDPTRPYLVPLRSGAHFPVFFYDGPIARAVAFGEALGSGEDLMARVEAGFSEGRKHDEVLAIAVDGETFGHHRKGGDEVVASAIRKLSRRGDVQLVNLAQALELFPPSHEAEIFDGSSWSCAHGIERWRSDCGCSTSSRSGWRQHWRAPLRAAPHSGPRQRPPRLRAGSAAVHRRAGHGGGALRHRRPGGGLPPQGPHLLPRGPDQLPPPRGRRHRRALRRAHRGEEPDHAGADRPQHLRPPLLRRRLPVRSAAVRSRAVHAHRAPAVR